MAGYELPNKLFLSLKNKERKQLRVRVQLPAAVFIMRYVYKTFESKISISNI